MNIRVPPREKFTLIRNTAAQDPRLSLQAKGLMTLMLSFPDEWTFNQKHLFSLSQNGRDAQQAAINELKEHGYLQAVTTRDDTGRITGKDYLITDAPNHSPEKPGDGEYHSPEKPSDGKSGQHIKTYLDKDLSSSSSSSEPEHPTQETTTTRTENFIKQKLGPWINELLTELPDRHKWFTLPHQEAQRLARQAARTTTFRTTFKKLLDKAAGIVTDSFFAGPTPQPQPQPITRNKAELDAAAMRAYEAIWDTHYGKLPENEIEALAQAAKHQTYQQGLN